MLTSSLLYVSEDCSELASADELRLSEPDADQRLIESDDPELPDSELPELLFPDESDDPDLCDPGPCPLPEPGPCPLPEPGP